MREKGGVIGSGEIIQGGGRLTSQVPSTLQTSHPEWSALQAYAGGVHSFPRESKPVAAAMAVAARATIARTFIVSG